MALDFRAWGNLVQGGSRLGVGRFWVFVNLLEASTMDFGSIREGEVE